ncbi:MAG TPA: hypothetical protein PLV92_19355, partial [Pirellulaceae bacterium]|nr:hypothetical protein [Pirellulaceae bacterium]
LRRSAIEQLEERRVFTCGLLEGWKDELGQQLGEFKTMIDEAVHLGQQLPVIGDHLNNVQNLLDNFDTAVPDAIEQGALDLGEEAIRQALFQVLHNSPLDMLGDTDGDGVDPQDITVQFDSSGETCSLSIGAHLTRHIATLNLPIDAKFGLGLPALPFDIETSGGITAGLQLEWPDFHLTIDQSGVNLDLSSTNDVQLTITAGLDAETELTADIGFLHAKVTDGVLLDSANGPAQALNTQLVVGVVVDISSDANGNLGFDADVTATADVALHIDAMIDQNFPSIGADFVMHWDVLGDNASEPTVDFKNVTIDFGGYLSSMLSPLVDFVKEVTEPIQPVVDVVTAPIPVLSDLAHLVGLGDVSILSLAQVADDYMESTGYKEVIEIAEIIVQVVDIVQQIDNSGETLKFDVGDISLNADNNNDGTPDNGDLRNRSAAKKIDDMSVKDLTDLATSPTSVADIEEALMNSDLPDVVKENVGKVLAQFSSGIGYSFPILDNPLGELGKLLVGRDSSLFEFQANLNATASADLKVPIGMGIDAIVDGNYQFDAKVVLGYDTFGLRKFIVNGINNNDNFNGFDLLDGIYIDSSSHISLDGGFSAGVGVDYAVASAEVTG